MEKHEWLAERFEANRTHLRGVAYRMLGSLSEADDAVQEAWLRLSRSDTSGVENLGGWLTTVVARVCLDMLRSRNSRREELLGAHVPEPLVHGGDRVWARGGRAQRDDREESGALIHENFGTSLFPHKNFDRWKPFEQSAPRSPNDSSLVPANPFEFQEKLIQPSYMIEHQATEDPIKRGTLQRQWFSQIVLQEGTAVAIASHRRGGPSSG